MNPPLAPDVAAVLARFALPGNIRCEPHASDGLSGGRVWKIVAEERAWCLKRYPAEHPTAERLAAIQAAVRAAADRGLQFLAPPIADRTGATAVSWDGRLWELAPWLPGAAVNVPSAAQAQAAFAALGRLHETWRDLPWDGLAIDLDSHQSMGPAPGLQARLRLLVELRGIDIDRWAHASQKFADEPWSRSIIGILTAFRESASRVETVLRSALREVVPRHVCLRDARPEHFLFVADRVSGVIDYDAVRVDSPLADLARLVSEWNLPEVAGRLPGIEAYDALRPLSAAEHTVLHAFRLSAAALTGMQWLKWIFEDGRTFPAAVLNERLPRAAAAMLHPPF